MMKTVWQLIFHHPPAPPQCPMDFSQQPHSKYIFTISDDLDDDEEEDFQTVSLEDDHWTT